MTNGLSFGTGLTWSKSMDNGGSGFYGVENGPQSYSTFQNYNDPVMRLRYLRQQP